MCCAPSPANVTPASPSAPLVTSPGHRPRSATRLGRLRPEAGCWVDDGASGQRHTEGPWPTQTSRTNAARPCTARSPTRAIASSRPTMRRSRRISRSRSTRRPPIATDATSPRPAPTSPPAPSPSSTSAASSRSSSRGASGSSTSTPSCCPSTPPWPSWSAAACAPSSSRAAPTRSTTRVPRIPTAPSGAAASRSWASATARS